MAVVLCDAVLKLLGAAAMQQETAAFVDVETVS